MSRKKVSTLLDPVLYRQVKAESMRQDKQISHLIGEALEHYLFERTDRRREASAVAATWGTFLVDRELVDRVLADEDGLLDA